MQLPIKKTVLSVAIAVSAGAPLPALAAVYNFEFKGLFTMLTTANKPVQNSSDPYYWDPAWGYGMRTPITGTMRFDTATGKGSGTVGFFEFYTGGPALLYSSFQTIGNGMGGSGSLVLGNMSFDWNGATPIPVSIVLDAQGLFGAMQASGGALTMGQTVDGTYGVLGASDGVSRGTLKMGNMAMASTTWNTTLVGPPCVGSNGASCMGRHPSGGLPLVADSMGGSPMVAGPFTGLSVNLDVQSMKVVPVPAAVWLLGSGLVGLFGLARRRGMPA